VDSNGRRSLRSGLPNSVELHGLGRSVMQVQVVQDSAGLKESSGPRLWLKRRRQLRLKRVSCRRRSRSRRGRVPVDQRTDSFPHSSHTRQKFTPLFWQYARNPELPLPIRSGTNRKFCETRPEFPASVLPLRVAFASIFSKNAPILCAAIARPPRSYPC
jgi:hypothetical protein